MAALAVGMCRGSSGTTNLDQHCVYYFYTTSCGCKVQDCPNAERVSDSRWPFLKWLIFLCQQEY